MTTDGRTGATAVGSTVATGAALGATVAIGSATSVADALGAGSEGAGATLALAAVDVPVAAGACAVPVFRRSITTTRIASATPTTDPATITDVRRRFCCSAAASLALEGSPSPCCIKAPVEVIDENPGAAMGGGGPGGGGIGAAPVPWLLILSATSEGMRIVPWFVTLGSAAHAELGSSFAVVGIDPAQLAPLPNAGSSCSGNVVLKLGQAGDGSC